MDNFKKYLQENKQDLDLERPDSNLWSRIDQDLEIVEEKKNVFPIKRWMAAAACLAILLVSSYFLLYKNKSQQQIPTIAKKVTPTNVVPLDEDNPTIQEEKAPERLEANPPKVNTETFAITEKKKEPIQKKKTTNQAQATQYVIADVEVGNFSQLIEYQRQYISTLPIYGQKPGYFNDFKQQLKQMDNDEKDVRNDIKKTGLNANKIDLLINIYQQKITLLKQLSQEINRINKSYYQNHMQQDSTGKIDNPHFLNL